jgi:hypothetical protein
MNMETLICDTASNCYMCHQPAETAFVDQCRCPKENLVHRFCFMKWAKESLEAKPKDTLRCYMCGADIKMAPKVVAKEEDDGILAYVPGPLAVVGWLCLAYYKEWTVFETFVEGAKIMPTYVALAMLFAWLKGPPPPPTASAITKTGFDPLRILGRNVRIVVARAI